jgi:small subunit ribosomal protein S18
VPSAKRSTSGQKTIRSGTTRSYIGVAKGYEPRPAFFDYKDVAGLKKFVSASGKIMSRKRTGLSASMQAALTQAIKKARFMALMPYVPE